MKTMNHPNAKAMLVQPTEVDALRTAERTLFDVQTAFGGDNTIMSLENGEIIQPHEIARARAILDFIATYRMVEVNPQ